MVTQDIAYAYICTTYMHTYIHIYITYTFIHEEPQKDLVNLRTSDSNTEFVKNSYYLYVIVQVWVLSNR